ncbi:MAG: hypothetical protein Q8P92_01030 [Candidatus Daviesbacteria bacterium]|nr:hypothetical protein [Candidatus Daviesbacteria bacterium]
MKKIYPLVFILVLFTLSPIIFAQSECPLADSANLSNEALINNCSITQLSELPNERLITFPAYILTQLPLSRLAEFSNRDLIKIGQGSGDLIGFLSRFTNERLLTFDLSILRQLPLERQKTFSCDIQIQLGLSCGGQQTPIPTATPRSTPISTPVFIPQTISSILINGRELAAKIGNSLSLTLPINDTRREANILIPVRVNYERGSGDSNIIYKNYLINFRYQPPKPQVELTGDEYPVDVYIDDDFLNLEEAKIWITDIINNYLNSLYIRYNIKHRVRLNSVEKKNIDQDCSERNDLSISKNIRVYIPVKQEISSWAWPTLSVVCQRHFDLTNESGKFVAKTILAHEFGHIFGLTDLYLQDVYSEENMVANISITSNVKDIMWQTSLENFHPVSREISNQIESLPIIDWHNRASQFTPKFIILQILGDGGQPLPGVKVEIFPQVLYWYIGWSFPRQTIPNIVSFSTITDATGRVFLGDEQNIFFHKNLLPIYSLGNSALLRVTYNNEVRYASLTLSYLNRLYFDYGQRDAATINQPFSQLIKAPSQGQIRLYDFNKISSDPVPSEEERRELEEHVYEQLKADGIKIEKSSQPLPSQIAQVQESEVQQDQIQEQIQPTINQLYDLNTDGAINSIDTSQFLQDWRTGVFRDFNEDGTMNTFDYSLIKKEFIQ